MSILECFFFGDKIGGKYRKKHSESILAKKSRKRSREIQRYPALDPVVPLNNSRIPDPRTGKLNEGIRNTPLVPSGTVADICPFICCLEHWRFCLISSRSLDRKLELLGHWLPWFVEKSLVLGSKWLLLLFLTLFGGVV